MSDTLTDIRATCKAYGQYDSAYYDKQIHHVPAAPVVDRVGYIVEACKGKVVLSLGCSGALQPKIEAAAARSYGFDVQPQTCSNFRQMDLDDVGEVLEGWPVNIELVVAGEVIEHLTNPGRLLRALRIYRCPVLITVPNAHSDGGLGALKSGHENVNDDHVAYYSWYTLKKLVEKCGYAVKEFAWYNGRPLFAEGLIMIAEQG